MKHLLSYSLAVLTACGTTTTGVDGGSYDASSDSSSQDASANDSSSDAGSSDGSAFDGSGDAGLKAGDTCDPQNNLCSPGLLCCSEPTHMPDAQTGYFCEKPVNKSCPLLP